MVRTNFRIFDPLFWHLIHQPTRFYESPIFSMFSALSIIFEILFSSKWAGIWEKYQLISTQVAPIFKVFVTERLPIFALHACVWGDVAPSNTALSEIGKFCILETESCNLVNWCTFRCKFDKGDEYKIPVLQAQPIHLCLMEELHWRAGMITTLHWRGYILQPPSIWLCTS